MIENTTLRTFMPTNGKSLKLNKDNETMQINDSKNALNLTSENDSKVIRHKEYRNGKIVRNNSNAEHLYFSEVPKNGTGKFFILDNYNALDGNLGKNKVAMGGEIKNGKITKLDGGKILPTKTLDTKNIKEILAKEAKNEINLQNLTKVYLNKALKFLKK